jgi:hypothetical protein
MYLQKLALTSPTGGGRSVGIVRSRTQATEFSFSLFRPLYNIYTYTIAYSFNRIHVSILMWIEIDTRTSHLNGQSIFDKPHLSKSLKSNFIIRSLALCNILNCFQFLNKFEKCHKILKLFFFCFRFTPLQMDSCSYILLLKTQSTVFYSYACNRK